MAFTHLHVHTHYSLLDGACKVPDLVKRAKALGMDSLAITDHGCMFGVIEFFNECKKEGIKPILGLEAYMAPTSRKERKDINGEAAYHLLLLAKDMEGYKNLLKLSSASYIDGFYRKPRIDKDILREHSKGLIATSACLGGEVPGALMKRDAKTAREIAETYAKLFEPDQFFIEIQKQGIKEQDDVNPELVEIAKRLGVGIVGTNDVHFLNKEDHFAHDVLCCISMGRLVSEEGRLKYPTELYLKSPDEMAAALGQWPEAIENTTRIAAMCDLQLDFSKRYAPVYRVPPEKIDLARALPSAPKPVEEMKDDERYLRQLCEEGLLWRYATTEVEKTVRDRLEHELKIICMKQFCSYFLIVWDFCNYARDNGIPVGARGSGVGTMVGYLLGLCNVDPVKYNLLFERFMDPSRNEMPDIDIDICQDGRGRVIDYVRKKYGHVAQIITFGTLAAKAACKDVGRVLGVPLADIDKLTKLIPGLPGTKLKKSLDDVPELKDMYNASPQIKQVIDLALKLEGMNRNAGCHAAGVIIADQPLDTVVPLYTDKDDNILTQFEGPIAEKCGLLKMDFLGLRTLTTLTRSLDLELTTRPQRGETRGQWKHAKPAPPLEESGRIDIEKIDLADRNVLELFCRGETKGIFQFESGGMQDLLMKMQPDRVEDLIAANALYRPGPMELIPTYCNRKHGREKVPEVHPIMDAILAETYGIMCIHEDARVSMADGSERPIRDVRLGDRVHSLNVATRQFEIKECHGCGPTKRSDGVRITLENGFSVTLTDDHKVFTIDGMKEAGQLDPATDLVTAGRLLTQEKATARHIAPWLGADEDVAYLMGSLVGDGCLTGSGIAIATGREADHRRFVRWIAERLPSIAVHEYFHGRSWYVSLSHPQLLNVPGHGNRKTRLHHLLETHGLKTKAQRKRVPEVIFRCNTQVRAAFLAGLLDADGCTAESAKGAGVCLLTSCSKELLHGVRRLCQLQGIPATIRAQRLQFWGLAELSRWLGRFLLVRKFVGKLTEGASVGWIRRETLHAAVPAGESYRAFSARTGIMRQGMSHDFPFVKSSTAAKAGIDLGHVRYFRIAKIERVFDQQFYGMSVADHHNLVADGIVVKNCYQEQVMQVFNQLGGIELSNAYKLIKAISKKTTDVIAKFQPEFLKGTMAKGVNKEKAEEIFDLILKFGGYGFNKSHSTRYAIIAYQTAYMKVYHPVEYMSALLTFEMGSTEKVVEYIEDCRRMVLPDGSVGIKVLPPDVNISDKDFTPVYVAREQKGRGKKKDDPGKEGVIRFGMMAVRGVGEKAVETVIKERVERGEFPSLYDFCERVDLRTVTRSTIDALIRCGAFSSMGAKRAQLMNVLDRAVEMGQQSQNDKRSGQMSMFGQPQASASVVATPKLGGPLPDVDEFQPAELLKFEKELLGFYITSHPLTEHQAAIDRYTTASTKDCLTAISEGTEVTIGCMLNAVRSKVAKSGRSAGQKWAILVLEDLEGTIEAMCFAEAYAAINQKYPDAIKAEHIVFVKGKVDKKRETPSIMVNEILPIDAAVDKLTTALILKLDRARHTLEHIEAARGIIKANKGTLPVFVQTQVNLGAEEKTVTFKVNNEFGAKISRTLVDDLRAKLGNEGVDLAGAGSKRKKRLEQQRLFKEEQLEATEVAAAAIVAEPSSASDDHVAAAMDLEMEAADA